MQTGAIRTLSIFLSSVMVFSSLGQTVPSIDDNDDVAAQQLYALGQQVVVSEDAGRKLGDNGVCELLSQTSELNWVESYSQKKTQILQPLGITPAAVHAVAAKSATQLAYALLERLEAGKALKRDCGFGSCHEGMCGDGIFPTTKLSELAEDLEAFVKAYDIAIPRSTVIAQLERAYRHDAGVLVAGCKRELELYRSSRVPWPTRYRQLYTDECRSIVHAIHGIVPASVFNFDPTTTEQLAQIDATK